MKGRIILLLVSVVIQFLQVRSDYNINKYARVHSNNKIMTFKNIDSSEILKSACSGIITNQNYYDSTYGIWYINTINTVLFENTTFKSIPSIVFEKLTALSTFTATSVELEEINRKDFESAKNLKTLNLSMNKVTRLENMIFFHCKSLESIDLSRNDINWIHDNAFDFESNKLEQIDLSFNKLTTIKEDFLRSFYAMGYIRLNLESNEIEEIAKSTDSFKVIKFFDLNLNNNKLKHHLEFVNVSISTLKIENNEIESFNFLGVIRDLQLNDNRLQELHVHNQTTFVSAERNNLTKFVCDINTSLETASLSRNRLQNEVLLELKNSVNIKTLELSDNLLTTLSVKSFANFESLEKLRIDRNAIDNVDFGLFSHQKNLTSLNISYNAISSLNFHVLSPLTSLVSLDISGNNLTNIKDFQVLGQILPSLKSIGLEGNNSNCENLSNLKISLASQGIEIIEPVNRVKDEKNIFGIKCSVDFIEKIDDDKNGTVSITVNKLVDKLNQMNSRVAEIENSKSDLKNLITNLQSQILTLKSENIKNQLSSLNATNVNEVRSMVEQISNMTLEKQKLANDQLTHLINVQKLEIEKLQAKVELSTKAELSPKPQNSPLDYHQHQPLTSQSSGLSSLEIVLIVVISTLSGVLLVFGLIKLQNSMSNFSQTPRHRPSRRNSDNTVITFDNSSVQ